MSVETTGESHPKKLNTSGDSMDSNLVNSTNEIGLTSASLNLNNLNGPGSEISYHSDNEGDDTLEDADGDLCNDDAYIFDDDYGDDDEADYLRLQRQFDFVDFPPGVEATVSWMNAPGASSVSVQGAGPSMIVGDADNRKTNAVAAGPSSVGVNQVLERYSHFKQFDSVDDFSDHHYTNSGFLGLQPPSSWTKKIQEEWRILEKDLPDSIYVRVFESRIDLLRAVIVGPDGTPYHDGLFVFDVLFPPTYPDTPPMVYYYSGGLRLNPNLYDCGKVCLSLLNTWNGKGNEKWIPKTSTMLQVLVSIQALILNAKPFFNEPGYENTYVGKEGEMRSKDYNEDVFILSLKTMIYTIRRPPKHFEDLVAGHFCSRAHNILSACKAYMEGAQVGSMVDGKVQDGNEAQKPSSLDFNGAITRMMNGLINNFTKCGAKDCEQFRIPG